MTLLRSQSLCPVKTRLRYNSWLNRGGGQTRPVRFENLLHFIGCFSARQKKSFKLWVFFGEPPGLDRQTPPSPLGIFTVYPHCRWDPGGGCYRIFPHALTRLIFWAFAVWINSENTMGEGWGLAIEGGRLPVKPPII